jgi:DNA-binding XRE family transcriptional regulator
MSDLTTIARISAPGGLIRERRIELGWTPGELANPSGLAEADILKIENGRLDARWSTVHRSRTCCRASTCCEFCSTGVRDLVALIREMSRFSNDAAFTWVTAAR